MTGALIILAALIVIGAVLYVTDRLYFKPRELKRQALKEVSDNTIAPTDEPTEGEGECCGLHITCEKDSLSPFTTEAEYYDDEELDRFRGRGADEYTPDEADEFRQIMLTMRVDEIAGWVRALQVRAVTLPAEIRDEVLLIVAEERARR